MKIQSEKHCHLLQQQLKEITQKLLTIDEKRMIETEGYMVSSNETKQRLHTMEEVHMYMYSYMYSSMRMTVVFKLYTCTCAIVYRLILWVQIFTF